jgi:hypothetical protein
MVAQSRYRYGRLLTRRRHLLVRSVHQQDILPRRGYAYEGTLSVRCTSPRCLISDWNGPSSVVMLETKLTTSESMSAAAKTCIERWILRALCVGLRRRTGPRNVEGHYWVRLEAQKVLSMFQWQEQQPSGSLYGAQRPRHPVVPVPCCPIMRQRRRRRRRNSVIPSKAVVEPIALESGTTQHQAEHSSDRKTMIVGISRSGEPWFRRCCFPIVPLCPFPPH